MQGIPQGSFEQMKITFNDLFAQYQELKFELDTAIDRVISSSMFVRGDEVMSFELEFSEKTNSKYCVSCANGTDALRIAMFALGVRPGCEVIVPAHTWVSTAAMVTEAGGKPVFCDTFKDDFTIDYSQLDKLITSKTVGVIPVHLFGQPAYMEEIVSIARKHNLWIIEDCAQAHFAEIENKQVGQFGDVATYSFYPGKNLGAMGDAGAVTTNNQELGERMRRFANHGGLFKGEHLIQGINSRLDGIQAAVLRVKLKHVLNWHKNRVKVAERYIERLDGNPNIVLPSQRQNTTHAWHLFVIKTDRRDSLKSHLAKNNVPTIINYPIALPFLPCFEPYKLGELEFQNAYHNQSQILSLPLHPYMKSAEVDFVCKNIENFFMK